MLPIFPVRIREDLIFESDSLSFWPDPLFIAFCLAIQRWASMPMAVSIAHFQKTVFYPSFLCFPAVEWRFHDENKQFRRLTLKKGWNRFTPNWSEGASYLLLLFWLVIFLPASPLSGFPACFFCTNKGLSSCSREKQSGPASRPRWKQTRRDGLHSTDLGAVRFALRADDSGWSFPSSGAKKRSHRAMWCSIHGSWNSHPQR